MNNKIITLSMIYAGYLTVFVDLPIFMLFGVVFVGIMIEMDKIEKKFYPVVSNIILSSVIGWGLSFGVKHKFPGMFEGELKIFTMLLITLFGYVSIIYLLKRETIQKFINNFIKEKLNSKGKNDNDDISST